MAQSGHHYIGESNTRLRLEWERTGQSIANNTSTFRFRLLHAPTGTGWGASSWTRGPHIEISVGNNIPNTTFANATLQQMPAVNAGSTRELIGWTSRTFTHNDNGNFPNVQVRGGIRNGTGSNFGSFPIQGAWQTL